MVPLVGLGLQIFHGLRCPFALVEKASDRLRRCLWRCLYLVVRDGEQPVPNVGRGPDSSGHESLRCFRSAAGGHWQNVDVLGQNQRRDLHYPSVSGVSSKSSWRAGTPSPPPRSYHSWIWTRTASKPCRNSPGNAGWMRRAPKRPSRRMQWPSSNASWRTRDPSSL